MKCITNNVAAAKTAAAQTGIGLIIVAVSLLSKSLLLTLVGAVVLVLGIRGFMKLCKD